MNKLIIDEFNHLINYFHYQLDNTEDYKDKNVYIYKINAISNGISIIKSFKKDLSKENNIKELSELKGIGKGIINRIKQINQYGYLPEIKEFKEINNINKKPKLSELYNVYGLGVQTIKTLENQGITTIKQLKDAIKNNKFQPTRIIQLGLKYYNKFQEHIERNEMYLHKLLILQVIKQINKDIKFTICGSYRRGNPFSNDIDCILTHKDNKNYLNDIIQKLIDIGYITDEITESRINKSMAFCLSIDYNTKEVNKKIIRRIDFLYVPFDEYVTSLFYFTGDKHFNQYIRKYAKSKGYKLNEHGLFKNNKKIDNILSEKDIFIELGLPYIKPAERQYNKYIKY